MSYDDVLALDLDTTNVLWEAITIIEARQVLTALDVSMFPKLKQAARTKLLDIYKKLAYPRALEQNKNYITLEDAQRMGLMRARG